MKAFENFSIDDDLNYCLRQDITVPLSEFIEKLCKIPFKSLQENEIYELIQLITTVCTLVSSFINLLPPLDAPPPPKARERKIMRRKYFLVGKGNSLQKRKPVSLNRQFLNFNNIIGKLLFAAGGIAGKTNDRYVVTVSNLKNLIKGSEIIYGDDGFFEKDPFIHTPKFLQKNKTALQRLSSWERNNIEMFF